MKVEVFLDWNDEQLLRFYDDLERTILFLMSKKEGSVSINILEEVQGLISKELIRRAGKRIPALMKSAGGSSSM